MALGEGTIFYKTSLGRDPLRIYSHRNEVVVFSSVITSVAIWRPFVSFSNRVFSLGQPPATVGGHFPDRCGECVLKVGRWNGGKFSLSASGAAPWLQGQPGTRVPETRSCCSYLPRGSPIGSRGIRSSSVLSRWSLSLFM